MAEKKAAFDTELVSTLARILNETDLTEIEVEQGEMRVRVSREPAPVYMNSAPAAAAAPAPAPALAPALVASPAAAHLPAASSAPALSGKEMQAPMVGTAYLSPSPDSDSFVTVGQSVKEGETLLIIEAMKVMNPIAAPRSGKITAILINDGEPVEYGQPLLVIE